MLKKAYLYASLMASIIPSYWASAQSYYPGGLGNTQLILWLTAADPTTVKNAAGTQASSGSNVATWTDKSGKGSNAVQATSGSQPIYQSNQLNGFGGVLFQNTSEYMTGASGAYQTIVTVRSMPGTGHYQYLFSSPANADFSIRGGGASSIYTDGPNSNDWPYNTGGTSTQWINGTQSLNGSNTNHILVSAAAAATNATYSLSNYNPSQAWSGRGMNGNDPVYELLAYNTTLNNTQRSIVENYEASMWGLTSLLPTSGFTIFTPPGTASYNRNLVGIGNSGGGDNFTANPSGSTDGLGFSSGTSGTSFLGSSGFLMAAHNGQSATVIANASLPNIISATSVSIWNRSWYMEEFNGKSTGALTIKFNFSDYNGSTPNATLSYQIIYNATDGTFTTGTNKLIATTSTTVSGSTVSFGVTASSLPNGYYTIIYSSTPITLPVTLISFTGQKQATEALLQWTAASKTGIDRFDVTRSTDGIHFDSIGVVAAVADNTYFGNYTFNDVQPAGGANYYRLRMVDRTGEVNYSGVVALQFPAVDAPSISTYPNPVQDVLNVHFGNRSAAPVQVQVYTATGRCVYAFKDNSGSGTIQVPFQSLNAGLYIVEFNIDGVRTTRKILKNVP